MKKKVFPILIALTMAVCLTPTAAYAYTCPYCLNEDDALGKDVGDNVQYEQNDEGHSVTCMECWNVISSESHTVASYTYNNDATCIAGGTKTGTCTKCNGSVTVDDLDHPATNVHSSADKWTADETYHWHICKVAGCGAVIEDSKAEHADTEVKDHKCDTCGKVLGTCADHLEKVEQKAATTSAAGNIEYWQCTVCGNCFEDADAKAEITNGIDGTTIPKLPVITKRDEQTVTEGEQKSLTFTSDAEFEDFISVEIDGKTVEKSNYTVQSGSTVVTLNADYVAALSSGEHTLGIVSKSGTATTTFSINAKTAGSSTDGNSTDGSSAEHNTEKGNTGEASVKTGDSSNMVLWLALLMVSGGAVATAVIANKKRRFNR